MKYEANRQFLRFHDVDSCRAKWDGQPVDAYGCIERGRERALELDGCTVAEINDLVMRNDVIELCESISCKQRDKILHAAMKVTDDYAARLRSQIEIHAQRQTPIDESLSEAVQFAISVLERRKE